MNQLRNTARSGFTLIEVMIAIGIMTVGSLGILAMHQSVSHANRTALEMNTALAITERWIERLERDSLSWTERGLNSASLNGTQYLEALAGEVNPTDWFRPNLNTTVFPDGESYGFDHFGDDVDPGDPAKYCTNLRMRWLRQGNSARVDIRTFWFREGHMVGTATHAKWVDGAAFRGADCDAATADGWGLADADDPPPNIDVVHASTVVTWLVREGT
ncbi:MAG: prepilin-type N-terminal cleavage/methylation domain-containing protein [Polyangiales bacterium]